MDKKYGEFTKNGGFLIKQPDTPTLWENKLFNDEYVLNITQRLEGKGCTVKNYNQTGIIDFGRRFYFRANGEAVRLFCGCAGKYTALYETDKMTVCEENDTCKIKAEVTVPEKGKTELWKFTVENKTERDLKFDLFCFFPFVNNGPMGGESKLSENKKYMIKFSFPYHVRYEDKEKAEKNDGYVFIAASDEIRSFDGSAQSFYGSDNKEAMPRAVKSGRCSNTKGQGDMLDAAFQFTETAAAKDIHTITLVVGSAANKEAAEAVSRNMPDFDAAYKKAAKYRAEHFCGYNIETKDNAINALFNRWLPKQLVYLARLNRGGVYCPVRNRLQDALGYSILDPEGAFKIGLEILKRQHYNGFLKQWYMTDGSPEKDLCKMNHSDACIWLVLCITEIINNCGDISLFDKKVPYMDSDKEESVLTHLKKAVKYMYSRRGAHGLCLMLDGDWTDPINGAGRKGKGESVWNSMALIYAINNFTKIFPDEEFSKIADELKDAINACCWDGEWYIAGFDDNKTPFGGKKDEEGKLFLNTQTWAVISGTVPQKNMDALLKSIDRLKVPFGWLLFDKPFSRWNETWGRISLKQAGTTENGSVYCHATMFKALADCIRENKEAALDAVLRTLPINPENPPEKNLQLPLYVPNYYFGIKNENFGKSSCCYSTGTTAWIIWLAVKHILGIRTSVLGICKDEKIPKALEGTKIMRKFKGKEYNFNL